MMLDPDALKSAEQALAQRLRDEADQQRAYMFRFPDGRVSLELEWIDLHAITREVIAAYVRRAGGDDAGPGTKGAA